MPIYEHTYKTWQGQRQGPLLRWLAIPKFAYMEFFKVRVFVALLSMACVQLVLRLGLIYLLVNGEMLKAMQIPKAVLPEVNGFFFLSMIDLQLLFCFAFAFLLGAGMISKDLQHSALVLYFSKPISRWEYFLGKFVSLFSLFMVLTWVQTMILYVVQTAIAPDYSRWHTEFWSESFWLAGAITVYSTVICVMITLLILAASSLTKNSRYAGTTMVVYILGTGMATTMMGQFLGIHAFQAICPYWAAFELGSHMFRMTGSHEFGLGLAWTGVIGNCLLCAGILKYRLDRAVRYGR